MRVNTAALVRNLKGEAYQADGKDLTVGAVLAEALASVDIGGKMRLFVLAQKCYQQGEVEMDDVDLGLTVKAVEACKAYNNIIIGQALLALDAAQKS